MKRIIIICLLFVVIVSADDTQTFYIYEDDQLHPSPADKASVPLCTIDDTTTIAAYGGAVWGSYDLSDREYCIACSVMSVGRFDDFLQTYGYRRMPEEEQ